MLKIRLQRVGRKNQPSYRVVVTESQRGPKSGNYLEILGAYDPKADSIKLEAERIKHWISKGAQVSDTVHNILIKEKVIQGKTINVLPRKSPIVKEKEEGEEAPAEAPAEESSGEDKPAEKPKEDTPAEEAKEEKPAEEKTEEKVEKKAEEPKDEKKEEAPTEEKKPATSPAEAEAEEGKEDKK